MEISAEKTKLMTNSANGTQREINLKGQKLDTVTSFKYLGAIFTEEGSDFRCGALLFMVIHVIYKYKNK